MNCLVEMLGPAWVEFYHAMFVRKERQDEENSLIRMGAIEQDIDRCLASLTEKERGLVTTIRACTESARQKKRLGDQHGARKKLRERHRLEAQLERIQNSISVVESHAETLQGVELNKTIINTLRASGHALKSMGLKGGIEEVDKIITDVDDQLREANDITKAIGEGTFAQAQMHDDDLERELDSLLLDDDAGEADGDPPARAQALPRTKDTIYDRMPKIPPVRSGPSYPLADPRERQLVPG